MCCAFLLWVDWWEEFCFIYKWEGQSPLLKWTKPIYRFYCYLIFVWNPHWFFTGWRLRAPEQPMVKLGRSYSRNEEEEKTLLSGKNDRQHCHSVEVHDYPSLDHFVNKQLTMDVNKKRNSISCTKCHIFWRPLFATFSK